MKKIIVIIFITLSAVSVKARVIWDVRAGIGVSQHLNSHNYMNYGSMFAYKASVGLTVPLSSKCRFFFPLEYAKKGGTLKAIDQKLCDLSSIQLGFQFGYVISIKDCDLNVRIGPYGAGVIKNDTGNDYIDYVYDNTDGDIGVTGGIDLEYRHFVIGLEYQCGVIHYSTFTTHFRSSATYLTFGYRF